MTLLAVVLTTPAFAAKLYLKDGGVIQAKKVWRSGGKVHVWATRDTMTTFEKSEVDLKRTFGSRHRGRRSIAAVQPQTLRGAVAPSGAAASQQTADKKVGIKLPGMPKLPEKLPDTLAPSGEAGGTIRQHKKEMAEKIAE
jgi:hypothetical protein